jgi:hypothetical protein
MYHLIKRLWSAEDLLPPRQQAGALLFFSILPLPDKILQNLLYPILKLTYRKRLLCFILGESVGTPEESEVEMLRYAQHDNGIIPLHLYSLPRGEEISVRSAEAKLPLHRQACALLL